MESKIFFRPRLGELYEEGCNGVRTMVVGVHLLCEMNCDHKQLCCSLKGVRQMDCLCPEYEKYKGTEHEDYYRLSNCNSIELDSYIENEAKSPSFSMLTNYLLHEKGFISIERRNDLWKHLGFYNFCQHFQQDADTPSYDENSQLYKESLPAFREMLTTYNPQVLYIYSKQLAEFMHSQHIQGIMYHGVSETALMDVYEFHYNYIPHGMMSEEQLQDYAKAKLHNINAHETHDIIKIAKWLRYTVQKGILHCDGNSISVRRTADAAYLGRIMTAVFGISWSEFDSIVNYQHKTLRTAHWEHASQNARATVDTLANGHNSNNSII